MIIGNKLKKIRTNALSFAHFLCFFYTLDYKNYLIVKVRKYGNMYV